MSRRRAIIVLACFTAGFGGEASALEYCVTCEGPPAMYRCVIDGTPEGPGTNPTASLHCISQMATRGGHEACAVSRGAPFPCPGLTAIVHQPGELPAPPAPEQEAARPDAAEPAPEEKASAPAKPDKVPRTVEELAGQTVKSSQKGLQDAGEAIGGTAKKAGEHIGNAGSAIGNAAKTTWSCITSFFSHCSGESDAKPPAEEPPPAD